MILLLDDFKVYGGQEKYGLTLANFVYSRCSNVVVGRTARASSIITKYGDSQFDYDVDLYRNLPRMILSVTGRIWKGLKRDDRTAVKILLTSNHFIALYFGMLAAIFRFEVDIIYISHLVRLDHTTYLCTAKKVLYNIVDTIISMTATRVCVSYPIYKYYKKHATSKYVVLIDNPVPSNALSLISPTNNRWQPEVDNFDLAFIGRLSKEKGIAYLCDLLNILIHRNKEIKVVIFGDGPDKKKIEELVLRYPANIYYRGYVNNPHASVRCNVILFPSAYEGLSLSFLEAISNGFLPLTTKIPAFYYYLGDLYPYLSMNPKSDSSQIEYILKHPCSKIVDSMKSQLRSCSQGILSQELWESKWQRLLAK